MNSKVYTSLDNFQTGEKKQNNRGTEQTKAQIERWDDDDDARVSTQKS